MRSFIKKALYQLPLNVRYQVVKLRESWWNVYMVIWEKSNYPNVPTLKKPTGSIQNILIYHIGGLSFGGTEKNLQLIANSLADTYNVFFMYGEKGAQNDRKQNLNNKITFVPFSYTKNELSVPHRINDANPHIKEIIAKHKIDLIVTASPGYTHYPWNIIKNIPIVLLNIFGAPTTQTNIKVIIYNSKTTQKHASSWVGQRSTDHVLYAPLASSAPTNVRELGLVLRSKLKIKEDDFVFGRIGRADNGIFDEIGIRAWQKIADQNPSAHYLIMSPPPVLVDIVHNENIPRVHFLPPSGKEEEVWAFHGALDVMAHFRKDGETSGVAIAESLTIGNPVITHKSSIWNAHLEYLRPEFSRIAGIDNIDEYASYMQEYIQHKKLGSWVTYQEAAMVCGKRYFSPEKYREQLINIITQI